MTNTCGKVVSRSRFADSGNAACPPRWVPAYEDRTHARKITVEARGNVLSNMSYHARFHLVLSPIKLDNDSALFVIILLHIYVAAARDRIRAAVAVCAVYVKPRQNERRYNKIPDITNVSQLPTALLYRGSTSRECWQAQDRRLLPHWGQRRRSNT